MSNPQWIAIPRDPTNRLYRDVLLAAFVIAASLVLGASAPTPTLTPTVPPTAAPTSTPTPTPKAATATPAATLVPTATIVPTPDHLGLPPTPTLVPSTPAEAASLSGLPASQLPQTVPGLGRDEGTFLITAADDGSRAVFFIAGNTRHSILTADLQLEMQLNPLWPVRTVSSEDVLAFAEGGPIGTARTGLVTAQAPMDEATPETPYAAEVDVPSALDEPVTAQAAPDDEPEAQPVAEELAPQAAIETAPASASYVIRSGDNLTRVAAQYGTTVDALVAANGVADRNRIYAGQVVFIPGSQA